MHRYTDSGCAEGQGLGIEGSMTTLARFYQGLVWKVPFVFVSLLLFGLASGALGQDRTVSIQNAVVEAKFDPATGRFSLASRLPLRTFLREGRLSGENGQASVAGITDKTFGAGQMIEVKYAAGHHDAILVFPNLPFILFRSSLRNGGTEAQVTRKVRPLSGIMDWGKPAAELKTLGTGGLLGAEKNPGSYVWLAVAEPRSRNGVVIGWLTHERGSGVLFTSEEGGSVRLEAGIDYGRLRVAPGKTEELETLAIGYFDDARLGLEQWAEAVARVYAIKLPPQPAGYCTWYSRPYGGASDEKHLAELSVFAAKHLAAFGFSVIQIDDKWQAGVSTNGPKRNFTTHAPKGPYPNGMKAVADQVKSQGLVPGIWFMPFAGTYYDPFFEAHQDWFVKRESGAPFETKWGGTCLDLTHPGARQYLRENIRRFASEWGYQYFKMDGLWTGTATKQVYVNSGYKDDNMGEAVLHNPDKTNIEGYRDGLRLAREAAGKDVFFLGCCSPQNMRSYGGAFGLVDAMRVGPDNGADWDKLLRGPTFGSRQYFLHGRVWYNDPDPVYVRADVPLHEAQAICSWVALSGQLNLCSEWLPGLPPERLDILKRALPSHGLLPRPVDLFEEAVPRIWLLTDERHTPRRDVIGLFNWTGQETTVQASLAQLGLPADVEYEAFDFWGDALAPTLKKGVEARLPAQSCRILAVRSRLARPQVISTSRHITQGIVDVVEEKWNQATGALSGKSRVVASDAYELRITIPSGEKSWRIEAVELSSEDRAAGVQSSFTAEAGLARVIVRSGVSREVGWAIKFR